MAFTKEELEQLKGLLHEQKAAIAVDTERKIATATTNLARALKANTQVAQAKLEAAVKREIHTTADNLNQQMNRRFDQVDQAIEQLAQELVKFVGELHQDHELRIKSLERELHPTS
jgi:hypothetical protein